MEVDPIMVSVFIERNIEDVIINKQWRGLGLGKLMIDYAVDLLKEDGCYKIILNCSCKNEAFYAKCGFSKHGLEMSLYSSPI